MNVNEKLGPNHANAKRISDFCCLVKDYGLFDLGYNGPAYTWTNKRFSINPTCLCFGPGGPQPTSEFELRAPNPGW